MNKQDPTNYMQAIREWVRQGGASAPAPLGAARLTPLTDLDKLRRRLADIQAGQTVREQPFASGLPVLGPLIAQVRSAWNWMSTKWYVLPLLQQQNAFNTNVAQAWCDLLEYLKYTAFFAREVYERLDHLESCMAELRPASAPDGSPEAQQASPLADVVQAAAASWRELFAAGPVLVISPEREQIVRALSESGVSVYDTGPNVPAEQGGHQDVLGSAPANHLSGVLAVWSAPLPLQDAVRLLDQCRRSLRSDAWAAWVWPWPAASGETNALMARKIALGMGFRTVRLEAEQSTAFQSLLLRK